MRRWLWVLTVLACASTASADPIDIQVRQATYAISLSSFVSQGGLPPDAESRATTSDAAIGDYIGNSLGGSAQAYADSFSVFAAADAANWPLGSVHSAAAAATSILEFSPAADVLSAITVQLSYGSVWSSASVQLINLTTNELLWDLGWDSAGGPSIYGYQLNRAPLYDFGSRTPLTMEAALSASDQYRLLIRTGVSAMGDSGKVGLDVTGLRVMPVPEPATAAMLLVAAALLVASNGRRLGIRRWQRPHAANSAH